MKTSRSRITKFQDIESTQKQAHLYIKEGKATDGMILISETQTGGIGRLDRDWSSPKGGLWMSIITHRSIPLEFFQGFSVRIGLALSKVLEEFIQIPIKVKWPNDLILNGKKVGGILVDISSQDEFLHYLVLGIGINVNVKLDCLPDEVRKIATSINCETQKEHPIEKILDLLISVYDQIIDDLEIGVTLDLSDNWVKRSHTYNSNITVKTANQIIEGIEVGLTSNGELIIKTTDGEHKISIGEIEQIRKA